MKQSEPPSDLPPLPHHIDMGIKGSLAVVAALNYLLNKIATDGQLDEVDLPYLHLLRHYLEAWQAALSVGIPQSSLHLHGALLLLGNLVEQRTLSDGDLALADALLPVSRRWERYLKSRP